MLKLIADHMETGFLENIIDMFSHDPGLYEHLPGLMSDERSRVRIGTVALVETLIERHQKEILSQLTRLGGLLKHQNPQVRADAAYLLGVIGDPRALPALEGAADDEVEQVKEIVRETIKEIREKD